MGEAEQRKRFAYALQRAMTKRNMSARQLAKGLNEMDPRKIARWLGERDLPNLYESQALAAALKVDEDLFRNPPEVPPLPPEPYYPIDEYLLEGAGPIESGAIEGRRRAAKRLGQPDPRTPAQSPARPAPVAEPGRER